ncbi:AAA family ATPase [Planotetraspora sp. A-T 1434]|uniref:BTAD domain-containing putative transcriptional regulator n=1 Tax=Planotetraspora sp. A-T 1434 TaxID=2979219 RepID=UPI0021C1F04A|nr:BTAD domain-containing putative transcriptional regulator [Planotetraspora sp. A-T 1434]MCT9932978.1 AAA family ATPase [Planotetraspora sp. A-T 1434]
MAVFRVLGAFEAVGENGPIDLGGPRQRSVLARLLISRGQVVPVERMIDDLWHEQPPPSALASIQAYVSNLRRALEPGRTARTAARVLVTVPPGYAVRTEEVDAWRFEDLVRQAARSLAGGDARTALQELDGALALWRGPAYPEFAIAEWAMTEIARLGELHAMAVEQRASAAMALGLPGSVVADLRTHLDEHPLREEGWRLLAVALYRQGRQGDALVALREARRMLVDELGVDPGPALQRLEADILAQSPALEPAPPAPGTALVADGPTAESGPVPATGSGVVPASGSGAVPAQGLSVVPASGSGAVPAQGLSVVPASGSGAVPAQGLSVVPVSGSGGVPGRHAGPAAGRIVAEPARRDRLFGRESELAQLLALSRGIALIGGEAGIGKSALAEAAAAARAGAGWRVAVGRCPETGGAPAGWAWAEILRALTAAVAPGEAVAVQIARLLDPVGQEGFAPGADLTTERFRLRRALAAYLADAARTAPLLLVLDDLHRADDETLAVLVHLAGDLADAPVVIVGTFRDEEADRLADTSATLARHEPLRVALRGIDQEAAAGLLAEVSGAEVTAATLAAVADRTGGNPFFLRETARLIASEGETAAASVVPAGVRDVLRRRFARLPVPAQTVLREAAVMGRDIDVDVLTAVNGGGDDAVVDAVEAALMAGLLLEPGGGGVRFAHALVRDTLYDDMSRLRQTRTHARVAAVLERLRPDEVAALAHHFAAGGEPAKAARYAALAAEQAELRFAYREAAALWGQAIDLGGREDLELIMRRVRALALGNELAAAREMRERAIRLAVPYGDPELIARVVGAFDAPSLWSTKDYGVVSSEVVRVIEETLAVLPQGDGPARCALLTSLAFELEGEQTTRGAEAAGEALAMARRIGDPEGLVKALNARHFHTFRGDSPAVRERLGTELLRLAEANGMATGQVVAHLILMQRALAELDFPEADRHADQAERLGERYDLPMPRSLATFYRAFRLAIAGEYVEAERLYREGAHAHSRVGAWRFEVGLSYMSRYCLGLLQGDVTGMLAESELVAQHWDVAAEPYALALAAAGRTGEARQVAGRPRPIRPDYYARLFIVVRGLLGMALGDKERVLEAYDALAPYPRGIVTQGTGLLPLWPVAQVLGDLAAYLGRADEAAERYGAALEIATGVGATAWVDAARQGLAGITRPG